MHISHNCARFSTRAWIQHKLTLDTYQCSPHKKMNIIVFQNIGGHFANRKRGSKWSINGIKSALNDYYFELSSIFGSRAFQNGGQRWQERKLGRVLRLVRTRLVSRGIFFVSRERGVTGCGSIFSIELHKREREKKKKRKILQSAMYFYFGFFWPKIPGDLDLNHSLWCVIFKLFPHISHVKFCAGNAYKCMIYCFSLNLFRALDFLSFFVYKREQRTGTKHRRHTDVPNVLRRLEMSTRAPLHDSVNNNTSERYYLHCRFLVVF